MPPTCHRRISDPVRGSFRTGFSLLEALVALAVTVLLAMTAARLATSALERERRARADAETARAIQSLTAILADSPPPDESLSLPDGWSAAPQPDADLPDWQTWELHAPEGGPPRHILHVPARPGRPRQ